MNWGVIGYGGFAPKFLTSLISLPKEKLYAIATRSAANKAKEDHPDAIIYTAYDDLFFDNNLDIVYICTTHNFHHDLVLRALDAGKHVLCEKPLGVNTTEVQSMIDASKKTGKFLMEGMWTRFLPAYKSLKETIESGKIGTVNYMTAAFGFPGIERKERLRNKKLAGGATFDVGVYPIAFALDIMGVPDEVKSRSITTDQGVDAHTAIDFEYDDGRTAHLHCSVGMHTSKKAIIYGAKGYIEIPFFWQMESYTVFKDDAQNTINFPFESTGYVHEILAAVATIEQGKIETELWSHEDSLTNAKMVDQVLSNI